MKDLFPFFIIILQDKTIFYALNFHILLAIRRHKKVNVNRCYCEVREHTGKKNPGVINL